MQEVIFDGISFVLTLQTADEVETMLARHDPVRSSAENNHQGLSGVGISYGHHVEGNAHIPAINAILLSLGELIGQNINGQSIYLRATNELLDFAHYVARIERDIRESTAV